jgi:hypothetical protein
VTSLRYSGSAMPTGMSSTGGTVLSAACQHHRGIIHSIRVKSRSVVALPRKGLRHRPVSHDRFSLLAEAAGYE